MIFVFPEHDPLLRQGGLFPFKNSGKNFGKRGYVFYICYMEYSLDNIKQIVFDSDVIRVYYTDGTTSVINSNFIGPIKFTKGFVSNIDAPIIDHCI
jgi:hypothetical protein